MSVSDALAIMDTLEVVDSPGDLAGAMLEQARESKSGSPDDLPARRLIVTDAAGWGAARARLQPGEVAGGDFTMALVDDSRAAPGADPSLVNHWVESVDVDGRLADRSAPARVVARIGSTARTPPARVDVDLWIDGEWVDRATVELDGAAPVEAQFAPRLPPPRGSPLSYVSVEVAITPDRLALDDSQATLVPVAARPPLLIVPDGEAGAAEVIDARPWSSATTVGPRIRRPTLLRRVSPGLLESVELVIVVGVPDPGLAAGPLADFVRSGGGLIVVADGAFDPRAWREATESEDALERSGGILPGLDELFETSGDAAWAISADALATAGLGAVEPKANDGDSPGGSGAANGPIAVRRVVRLHGPRQSNERTLVSYANGEPWLLEREVGAGKCLFISAGLGAEWSDLAKRVDTLFADRLCRLLARRLLGDAVATADGSVVLRRPIEPGEPLWLSRDRAWLSRDRAGGEASKGAGRLLPVMEGSSDSHGAPQTLSGPWARGVYRASSSGNAGPPDEQRTPPLFVVQAPPARGESPLQDESSLRESVARAGGWHVGTREALSGAASGTQGASLWRWLLVVGVVVAAAESWLARRGFFRPGTLARPRWTLIGLRTALFVALIALAAGVSTRLTDEGPPRPELWVLCDVDSRGGQTSDGGPRSLALDAAEWRSLARRFDVRLFRSDEPDSPGVVASDPAAQLQAWITPGAQENGSPRRVARPLHVALEELASRPLRRRAKAVIVVSDFQCLSTDQLGAATSRIGTPLHALGLGSDAAAGADETPRSRPTPVAPSSAPQNGPRGDVPRLALLAADRPTREWRFLRELLRGDPAEGAERTRLYLRSADPLVRGAGGPFLETLALSRAELTQLDAMILIDLPDSAVSPRFADGVAEWVAVQGGALVVVSGRGAGERSIEATPLAELLPIEPAEGTIFQDGPLTLRVAPRSPSDRARRDLFGPPPWASRQSSEWLEAFARVNDAVGYRAAGGLRPAAIPWVEHASRLCEDGRTPAPIVVQAPFGRGIVTCLHTDQSWRLRRLGPGVYERFWGALLSGPASTSAAERGDGAATSSGSIDGSHEPGRSRGVFDRRAMQQFADWAGGECREAGQLQHLSRFLLLPDDVSPGETHGVVPRAPRWPWSGLWCILALGLLTAEWFARKRISLP